MAVTQLTDADIAGMLRRVYNAFENNIFPVVTRLLAQVEKAMPKSKYRIKWGGEGAYFPVTIGQPGGLYSSPGGALPSSSMALERQANETVKQLYIRRQVAGFALVGTASREAAFKSLATKIIREVSIASKLGMQRQLHGDSRGIIDLVLTTGTTTAVVNRPYGIDTTGLGQGGLTLEPLQTYQIIDPATALPRTVTGGPGNNRVTLASYTESGDNATMQFGTGESVAGMAANDIVALATPASTAYSATADIVTSQAGELNGLTNITNRGGVSTYYSLHNVSSATAGNALWDSVRMVAGTDTPSLNPTEDDIFTLSQKILGRSGNDPTERPADFLLVTTPGLVRSLAQSVIGQRRLVQEVELKFGYKGVQIAGMPAISDYWCPAGTIYVLHLPSLFKINAKDFGHVMYNGAGPWRWVDGYDSYESSWGMYCQFGTVNRTSHGMVSGYTDSSRFTHVVE